MSTKLQDNFALQTGLPLDAREKVADITARDAIPSIIRYEGMTVFVVSDKKTYQLQGGILNTNWKEYGASGTAMENFFRNGTAEDVNDMVLEISAPTNNSLTFTTMNPLQGAASFLWKKTATVSNTNNLIRNPSYSIITIPRAYWGRRMRVRFDYELMNAVTQQHTHFFVRLNAFISGVQQNTGIVRNYLYDTNKGRFEATFTALSDADADYLFMLWCGTDVTSSELWEMKVDNLIIEPAPTPIASSITEWTEIPTASLAAGTWLKAITSNPSYGTVNVNVARWRQVGENYELEWTFHQTTNGSAGSGPYYIDITNLPIRPDTSKVIFASSTASPGRANGTCVGTIDGNHNNDSFGKGAAYFLSSTQVVFTLMSNTSAAAGSGFWGSSYKSLSSGSNTEQSFTVRLNFKGAGLNAVTRASDGYDGRAMVASGSGSATGLSTTGGTLTKVNFSGLTILANDGSMIDTSNSRINIKSSGKYKLDLMNSYNSGTSVGDIYSRIYVNGVAAGFSPISTSTYGKTLTNVITVDLNSGDYIELYLGGGAGQGASQTYYFALSKIQSPQVITWGETLAFSYFRNSNQTITSGSAVVYNEKIMNTHGDSFYNTSTGLITGLPSGVYEIQLHSLMSANGDYFYLQKNGTAIDFFGFATASAPASMAYGSAIFNAAPSDQFYITVGTGGTVYGSSLLSGVGATKNKLILKRLK